MLTRIVSDSEAHDVVTYPRLGYSMNAVRRAGEALRTKLIWSSDTEADIREAFAIANDWRAAHQWPMRKIRYEIIGLMHRRERIPGLTAARLKRMTSVRKKLVRLESLNLNQIQDIAGCRVIVPSIADVYRFNDRFESGTKHHIRGIDPYIDKPKQDGYRTHHYKLEFYTDDLSAAHYNGRRVELQVRTRLQHAWATAVEAVGLFRSEDLKAGQGDPEWLRLFELMASEFASAEGCELIPNAPVERERRLEITELSSKLNAIRLLDDIKNTVEYTKNYLHDHDAKYYIVRYDRAKRVVKVEASNSPKDASTSTINEEIQEDRKTSDIESVIVEVTKIVNLQEAYPNYFGDVGVFMRNLRNVAQGKSAVEYTMPPQATVPVGPRESADLSWTKRASVQRHRFRRNSF